MTPSVCFGAYFKVIDVRCQLICQRDFKLRTTEKGVRSGPRVSLRHHVSVVPNVETNYILSPSLNLDILYNLQVPCVSRPNFPGPYFCSINATHNITYNLLKGQRGYGSNSYAPLKNESRSYILFIYVWKGTNEV